MREAFLSVDKGEKVKWSVPKRSREPLVCCCLQPKRQGLLYPLIFVIGEQTRVIFLSTFVALIPARSAIKQDKKLMYSLQQKEYVLRL